MRLNFFKIVCKYSDLSLSKPTINGSPKTKSTRILSEMIRQEK
jgi:hypothetical protein